MGFRLSQRNSGFVILDGSHRYVATGHEIGGAPEITLDQVAAWIATVAAREPRCEAAEPAARLERC